MNLTTKRRQIALLLFFTVLLNILFVIFGGKAVSAQTFETPCPQTPTFVPQGQLTPNLNGTETLTPSPTGSPCTEQPSSTSTSDNATATLIGSPETRIPLFERPTLTPSPSRTATASRTPTSPALAANVALIGSSCLANVAQTNLAHKPAIQSSTIGTAENPAIADRAVDGNTDGNFWHWSVSHTLADNNPPSWWQVDLRSRQTISSIEVWNRTDPSWGWRIGHFYVFVSNAPFTSNDLTTTINNQNIWNYHYTGNVAPRYTIPVNHAGRYVRIQLSGDTDGYLQLAEVQVLAPSTDCINTLVTTIEDTNDGDCNINTLCSLREAILLTAPGGTIGFEDGLAGTIALNSTFGQLSVNKSLTIIGPGGSIITVSGNDQQKILFVQSTGNLRLSHLTLAHGKVTDTSGGAISNLGTLYLDNMVVESNVAHASDIPYTAHGGAILNNGTLIITNSALLNNQASNNGGTIFNSGGKRLEITNTIISGSSGDNGASIFNYTDGIVKVTNSTISGSTGGHSGSAIYNSGDLTVAETSFINNTTDGNGTIFNAGGKTASIKGSTFSGNTAFNGAVGFNASTAAGNGQLTLINSTVTGNTATNGAAGIYNLGTSTLLNNTLSSNTAELSGVILRNVYTGVAGTGVMRIDNNILANSTILGGSSAANCYFSPSSQTTSSTTVADNIDYPTTSPSCQPSAPQGGPELVIPVYTGDPKLDVLGAYGGPTNTMRLLGGSAALNTGNNAVCVEIGNVDQRLAGRPVGAACEIGAFESSSLAQQATATITPSATATFNVTPTRTLTPSPSPTAFICSVSNQGQNPESGSPAFSTCPSPAPGALVFVSTRDGNPEIYAVKTDGTNLIRLTNDLAQDTEPTWSPDGTKIAFVSNRGGTSQIWVMNANGTQPHFVNDTVGGQHPTWSPTNTQIVFSSMKTGRWDIYKADVDGSNLAVSLTLPNDTTNDNKNFPSWTPNHQIAFVTDRTAVHAIYTMDENGNITLGLVQDPNLDFLDLAISSDGMHLAFIRSNQGQLQLYRMPVAGGAPIALNTGLPQSSHPSWSADGSQIAFDAVSTLGVRGIYIRDSNPQSTNALIPVMVINGSDNFDPAWSPNTVVLPTPTPSPTPTATATFAPTPLPSDPAAQRDYLLLNYGISLQGNWSYWSDPTFQQIVDHPTRVDLLYRIVTYYDETFFANSNFIQLFPGNYRPGSRFKAVFGPSTIFSYTGAFDPSGSNAAAYMHHANKTENFIYVYSLSGVTGPTDPRCGYKQTGGANPVDLSRCTITHELGHAIVARAAGAGANFAQRYNQVFDSNGTPVFGMDTPCPSGGTHWDPGQQGWPWRDHPIKGVGTSTYASNLCSLDGFIVLREFEADMIMNEVLDLFATDEAQQARRKDWTQQSLSEWIQDAIAFTAS
jgi:CSLREA domain-containing protein